MLVFIDDSGDPGFKFDKGSSAIFVIALIIFDDELEAEKASLAIKELRRKLRVSDKFEFKFNKMNRKFKNQFIQAVRDFKFKIRAIMVKKEIVYSPRLRTYKEDFYNHIIMQVLKHSKIKKAKLRFDRRGERFLRDQLRVYLSKQLDNKRNDAFTDLKFVNSRQNTLIQLADIIAGSIHAFYGGKDKSYLEKLKNTGRVDDVWEFK